MSRINPRRKRNTKIQYIFRTSLEAGNSYILLHYTPSFLTAKYNLSLVLFPDCEDPLIHRVDNQPECMFAPRRMAKVRVYFVSSITERMGAGCTEQTWLYIFLEINIIHGT